MSTYSAKLYALRSPAQLFENIHPGVKKLAEGRVVIPFYLKTAHPLLKEEMQNLFSHMSYIENDKYESLFKNLVKKNIHINLNSVGKLEVKNVVNENSVRKDLPILEVPIFCLYPREQVITNHIML